MPGITRRRVGQILQDVYSVVRGAVEWILLGLLILGFIFACHGRRSIVRCEVCLEQFSSRREAHNHEIDCWGKGGEKVEVSPG